jgi:hypothetical protein
VLSAILLVPLALFCKHYVQDALLIHFGYLILSLGRVHALLVIMTMQFQSANSAFIHVGLVSTYPIIAFHVQQVGLEYLLLIRTTIVLAYRDTSIQVHNYVHNVIMLAKPVRTLMQIALHVQSVHNETFKAMHALALLGISTVVKACALYAPISVLLAQFNLLCVKPAFQVH